VNCEFAQCRSLSHHNTAVCLKHVCTHTDQRTIRRTKLTLLIDNNDLYWKRKPQSYLAVLKWAACSDSMFVHHPRNVTERMYEHHITLLERSELSIRCLEILSRQAAHCVFRNSLYVLVCWPCSHARYRDVVDFQKRWHHRFSDDLLG